MKKSRIRKNLKFFAPLIIVMIISSYLIRFHIKEGDRVSDIIAMMSAAVEIISALLIVIQLRDTKKIEEAQFILNLNQSFVTNELYSRVYTELEKGEAAQLTPVEISNYLTFFESIYLLLQQDVISMSVLDDLFQYRFFLAVHNPEVQRIKLIDRPQNFRNIYCLENDWIAYRQKRGFEIYKKEYCLATACEKAGKLEQYVAVMKHKGD